MYTLIAILVTIVLTALVMGYSKAYPMPLYYETFFVPHRNYYPDRNGVISI